MQIHELPSGTPTDADLLPYDTGSANYKTPFSGFDVKENTATFTSGDEADPSQFKTVSLIETGPIKTLLNSLSMAVSNIRYIWKFIGQTAMGTTATTVTGAIAELRDFCDTFGGSVSGDNTGTPIDVLSGTTKALVSVLVPKGRWLIIGRAMFPGDANGARFINISSSSSGAGIGGAASPSVGANPTPLFYVAYWSLASSTRMYLLGYQNSGSTLRIADGDASIRAIKLSDIS